MTSELILEKARSVHGYKYKYINLLNRITLKDYITVEIDGNLFTQRVNKHLMGKCPEKMTPLKTNDIFISESISVWGDRFDYTKTKYISALKKVKLFDKKNNMFIEQIASLHLQGHECKNIDNDIFIEKSKLVCDFKYNYDECVYVNKTTKVKIKCLEHGIFEVKPFNHLSYGVVCKECLFTSFNRDVKKFLNKNIISYYQQHKFESFDAPFDFYIPSSRLCIEFIEICESLKVNDKIKNDYCEENFIDLIRIRYNQIDRIYDILNESLKNKL